MILPLSDTLSHPVCLYSPWKDMQISYLKSLQSADLQRRRDRFRNLNEMFLAYEVIPTKSSKVALTKPLILDINTIYNLNNAKKQQQKMIMTNNVM